MQYYAAGVDREGTHTVVETAIEESEHGQGIA